MNVGAAVAPGELEGLALDVALRRAAFLVQAVALDLARDVVVLHHGEVRGGGVVVVEWRRQDPGPLDSVVVRIRCVPLVPADLRPTQKLLHRRRSRGHGRRW